VSDVVCVEVLIQKPGKPLVHFTVLIEPKALSRNLMMLVLSGTNSQSDRQLENQMFALVSWIIFGLIVGALARLVLTGSDPLSWFATLSLSVAGSVIGGFVGTMLWDGKIEFLPGGFFISVLGAILVLLIVHKISRGAAIS
jgi:uncharacterized membrane protein YeaQ/YmgE (transglycosylase-associated protein family)